MKVSVFAPNGTCVFSENGVEWTNKEEGGSHQTDPDIRFMSFDNKHKLFNIIIPMAWGVVMEVERKSVDAEVGPSP